MGCCKSDIIKVSTPTLILNSDDDPVIIPKCTDPTWISQKDNKYVMLAQSAHGSHCAFTKLGSSFFDRSSYFEDVFGDILENLKNL